MDRTYRFLALPLLFAASLASPSYAATPLAADRVMILKAQRTMVLYQNGQVLKSYKIALGPNAVGPKTRQGDRRTPEGNYTIDFRNSHSKFHLSLRISYPNDADRERARKLGVTPGGDIMIHGLPDGYSFLGPLHTRYDWTEGCIAVTNSEIEEIWHLVPIGTPVEIKP